MRKHFSTYLEHHLAHREDVIFITGDLGYNALENLAATMGPRFINAGVAEQNMVGVAAGLASQGFSVICYSIAPFVVYRCLEQVRNDVCFHNLPVFIVGNGGGYGYGIMGPAHHAIEDIAVLSGLPEMQCYVPAFIDDMNRSIQEMFERKSPAYLRLGLGKPMPGNMESKPWGNMTTAPAETALTIVALGPVANNVIAARNGNPDGESTHLFVINKMPFVCLPEELVNSIKASKKVLVVEEHISIGGLGSALSLLINEAGLELEKFVSLRAEGYPSQLYGNQAYHQQLSGLDEGNISRVINSFL